MEIIRYVSYARLACPDNDASSRLHQQLDDIHQWAKRQSIRFDLVADFLEIESGMDYDRPELNRIRALARLGHIDAIVVARLDRLARDMGAFILLERFFKTHNVHVFSVQAGEFTLTSVSNFLDELKKNGGTNER